MLLAVVVGPSDGEEVCVQWPKSPATVQEDLMVGEQMQTIPQHAQKMVEHAWRWEKNMLW